MRRYPCGDCLFGMACCMAVRASCCVGITPWLHREARLASLPSRCFEVIVPTSEVQVSHRKTNLKLNGQGPVLFHCHVTLLHFNWLAASAHARRFRGHRNGCRREIGEVRHEEKSRIYSFTKHGLLSLSDCRENGMKLEYLWML